MLLRRSRSGRARAPPTRSASTAARTFTQLEAKIGGFFGAAAGKQLLSWMRGRGYVTVGSDKRIKEPKK